MTTLPVSLSKNLDRVSTSSTDNSELYDLGHWRAPGFMLVVLGMTALGLFNFIQYDEWSVPAIFIIASGLVLLPAIRRALQRSPQEMLADHLLVLAGAFMVYYVLGALLIPFGPPHQVDHLLSSYQVDAPMGM